MTPVITPRRGYALLGGAALAAVAMAVFLTQWLHLEPCPLCMFQRLLYLVVACCAFAAALFPRAQLAAGALALLATLGGLATAGYQSWIQAFPPLFSECGVGVANNPIEHVVDWLGRLIPWLFYAWGDCSSREWELFGLSMANWSGVVFFVMSGALAVLLWPRRGVVPRSGSEV